MDQQSIIEPVMIQDAFTVTPAVGYALGNHNLYYVQGNLLESPAAVLVNPCNTVGVSGGGLSRQFSEFYPRSIVQYKTMCTRGMILLGKMPQMSSPENGKVVMHFTTKNHWKQDSELHWIEDSLALLADKIQSHWPPSSYAFPLLGCGLGKLQPYDVIPLFQKYLLDSPSIILLYIN